MKSFYTSYYRFYRPKQREKKIFAISDIHFNDRVSSSLKAILRRAEQDEPSLIVITGDLVDDQDALDPTASKPGSSILAPSPLFAFASAIMISSAATIRVVATTKTRASLSKS